MEQMSGPSGDPQFRGNIPAYSAPDREKWTAKYGVQPYEVPSAIIHQKFFTRARAAVGRDGSTISFNPAVNAAARMDEINEAVASEIDTSDLVFFDPSTDSFWAYPTSV